VFHWLRSTAGLDDPHGQTERDRDQEQPACQGQWSLSRVRSTIGDGARDCADESDNRGPSGQFADDETARAQ
jgi:hypothetical protein